MKSIDIITSATVEDRSFFLRGQNVMIDRDIAELYGISTKQLNQQVKRNIQRFPSDFMFQSNENEKSELVTNCYRLVNLKYSSALPYAFTEHGAVMLASVLNSTKAAEVSIFVLRAFIKMRALLISQKELAVKLKELEIRLETHDDKISAIINVFNQFIAPPEVKKKEFGFRVKEKRIKYN